MVKTKPRSTPTCAKSPKNGWSFCRATATNCLNPPLALKAMAADESLNTYCAKTLVKA